MSLLIGRRELIMGGAGLALVPGAALAAPNRLAFQVFRNGTKVGEHVVVFTGDDAARTATTNVAMTVKIGPVPVFKYKHQAIEKWADGKWVSAEAIADVITFLTSHGARDISGAAIPVYGRA